MYNCYAEQGEREGNTVLYTYIQIKIVHCVLQKAVDEKNIH